ncbi:MAG: response regulator transcription factor [Elusimicrobiota bacterium]
MLVTKRQRTLVVEDDPGMREFYVHFFARLGGEGFTAVLVEDAERALDVLQHEPVDLMLLDWNLPGISGETLLRALRAHPKTRSVGVLMVTGRSSPADEIQALDSGADDHLAKPFDELVLLARLRSLGRRRELEIDRRQANLYPGLEFDLAAGIVRIAGRRVHLTPKEMGLFGIFLHRLNIHHTHAYLWEALWGYESDSWEQLLVLTLSSLRRKLGAEWGGRIKSREGRGYAFESPDLRTGHLQ